MGAFFLISGNDDFSVKERANEFVRSLCGDIPENHPALEIIRGDTENEKAPPLLDRLLDTLQTPSFLSPEKIVWLKHFNKFDEAFTEPSTKKKQSRIDLLSEFLKQGLPSDLTLIIDGVGLDRRKAFFKLAEKACEASGGALEWFEKADPKLKNFLPTLVRRIKEQVLNAGKRIDDDAVNSLAETSGGDAARLKNEIEKLIAYSGDSPTITLNDFYEVASMNTETVSWQFSNALAERNPAKALSLIPGIIETLEQERGASSRSEIAIISVAASEFKRLLAVRCEGLKLGIPDDAGSNYFYRLFEEQKANYPSNPLFQLHPFRAYNTWTNAAAFSDADFARAFHLLHKAYQGIVTGADPRLALESLVTGLFAPRGTSARSRA